MIASMIIFFDRVSLIFKIRNAKRVKIEDSGLIQRLIPLVLAYIVLLVIWTVAGHPTSQQYQTRNNLKFMACSENWWNHSLFIRMNYPYFQIMFLWYKLQLLFLLDHGCVSLYFNDTVFHIDDIKSFRALQLLRIGPIFL